jgi:hypothetical protein
MIKKYIGHYWVQILIVIESHCKGFNSVTSVKIPCVNQSVLCSVFTVVSWSVFGFLFHVCLNLQTAFFHWASWIKLYVFLICAMHPTRVAVSLLITQISVFCCVNLSQKHFVPTSHLSVPSLLCMWLISPDHLTNHTLCYVSHSNISTKYSIAFYGICSVFFLHIIHMMFLRAEPIFKVLWPVGICVLLTKDQGWRSGMWCSATGLQFLGFIFSGWWVQAEGQVWETGRNVYVYQSSCWRL